MPTIRTGAFWGCFDVLHVGHLNALEFCSDHCDSLTVGVATDDYCNEGRIYGNGYVAQSKDMVNSQADRLRMIESLSIVDGAYLYDLSCPRMLWEQLRDRENMTDIVFLNPEYEGSVVYEQAIKFFDGAGIEYMYVPRTANVSTSKVKQRLGQSDTNWIIDTMKEHLNKGNFYGSIKLNFQASKLVNINVDRSIVKPEKQGKEK